MTARYDGVCSVLQLQVQPVERPRLLSRVADSA